jgi:mono/diheme cytochrome c family protein
MNGPSVHPPSSILHPRFPRAYRCLALIGIAIAAGTTPGCRNEMYNQPKAEPLEMSTFFADSQASRPIIEGTVPRGGRAVGAPDAVVRDTSAPAQAGADTSVSGVQQQGTGAPDAGAGANGVTAGGEATPVRGLPTAAEIRAMSMPMKPTRQVLDRGRERYNIYCSPCHGRTGDGNGMIVQRGFPQPPSFHLDRLRTAADGHFYDVITNGFGAMYSYANRVKPDDRWAIAAYIRALQLSRNADAPLAGAER